MQDQPRKIPVTPEQVEQAIVSERELADRAAQVRDEVDFLRRGLSRKVFVALYPLMREKIPDGFISEVTAGKGKPYGSKGVRSLQVQINRMDAVWTPLCWGWRTEWISPSLAEVTVWIGDEDKPLVTRKARGGMNGGSTDGNHFKGTETNAAKIAFGRIGPGNEVYLGTTDFDPDTDEEAAEAQANAGSESVAQIRRALGEEVAQLAALWERAKAAADNPDKLARDYKLFLAAQMGVSTKSLDKALAELTPTQVPEVKQWLLDNGATEDDAAAVADAAAANGNGGAS